MFEEMPDVSGLNNRLLELKSGLKGVLNSNKGLFVIKSSPEQEAGLRYW